MSKFLDLLLKQQELLLARKKEHDGWHIPADSEQELAEIICLGSLVNLKETGPRSSIDHAGLVFIFNDMWYRQSYRFGSDENKRNIKQAVSSIKGRSDLFFEEFFGILKQHCPDAFRGLRLAFVGMDGGRPEQTAVFNSPALIDLLGDGAIARYEESDQSALSYEKALSVPNFEKFDYILTGNVLNAGLELGSMPVISGATPSYDVFLACARLSKIGGSVIHITDYDRGSYERHIDNYFLHALAGTKRVASKIGANYLNSFITVFSVFDQIAENVLTPAEIGKAPGMFSGPRRASTEEAFTLANLKIVYGCPDPDEIKAGREFISGILRRTYFRAKVP